ncbi:protein kinase domain-containing protein [Streptomyces cyaneofuscatus]|uniref:protein kinase domain-containing protein n=1 Tax=Streptomyces cyaneofuscatus TaxID=66883 RepID=UPI0037B08B5F|nr:serine/threonine-protein kinase [Streptomyces cyaneofuscatus]
MTATVTLTLLRGQLDTPVFEFSERATCVLGRADDCSPRLPDDTYHRTVSRHHCLLDINPPEIRIRDFGSRNGTYVNGLKIGQREDGQTAQESATLPFPERDLEDGDEIRIGSTVFRIDIRLESRAVAPPAPTRDVLAAVARRLLARSRSTGNTDKAADEGSAPGAPASIADHSIIRELGHGGMGAVFLARDQRTGREVALKIMLPKAAANEYARKHFLLEAGLTARLRHPNIAALYDLGHTDGGFFFTVEYCPGGDLDQLRRRRGGKLPPDEAVPLFLQVLEGLEYAHTQGIVHRDITPHNILLGNVPKLADFGLAKAFDQAGFSGLTRTGDTAGKPYFIPRQQVVNFKYAKPTVDLWSVAATLYHALTGRYPRDFTSGTDAWQTVLQSPPIPLRRRMRSVPAALADVIDHALQERPDIGFQTAYELRQELAAALGR